MVKIEVEVDTLQQLETALKEKIDAVLLDNMSPDTLVEAVRMVDGKVTTMRISVSVANSAPMNSGRCQMIW